MIVFSFPSSLVVESVKAPVTEMLSLLIAPTQDCLVDLPSWELGYEDTAWISWDLSVRCRSRNGDNMTSLVRAN